MESKFHIFYPKSETLFSWPCESTFRSRFEINFYILFFRYLICICSILDRKDDSEKLNTGCAEAVA